MKLENLSPEVAKDLIDLVNSLGGLEKTAEVRYGATRFKYVPIDSMLAEVKKNSNFAFMQPLGISENGTPYIQCILVHRSGEVIVSDPYRLVVKPGAKKQEEGAEITYSRRYSMASFFGIASDDDIDAQKEKDYPPVEQQKQAQPKQQRTRTAQKKDAKKTENPNLSESSKERINEALKGYTSMMEEKMSEAINRLEKESGVKLAEATEDDVERIIGIIDSWFPF